MSDWKSIADEIQMELQKDIASTLGLDESGDIPLISTNIDVLDLLLGGGIGLGTFTIVVGYSGSFKSTICAQIAKSYRENAVTEGITPFVVYIDTEASMSINRLNSLGLVNVKPVSNATIEQVFAVIDKIIMYKEELAQKYKNDIFLRVPALIVWDSIANTPTEAELKATDVNQVIGQKARVLSAILPKSIMKMQKYNINLLAINQFRDKVAIGPFQAPSDLKHLQHDKTMPGGNSVKFNASQVLEFKVLEHKTAAESKYGFRHAKIEVKTVKNKFFPDGYKVQLVIDVARGVDNLYTNFEFLNQYKKVTVGAWSYLKSYPEKKFRIRELREVYNTDTVFKQKFDEEVKNTIEEVRRIMSNNLDPESEIESTSNKESQIETTISEENTNEG